VWRAIVCLVVGIVVGLLIASPLYADKKNRRIIGDTDRDGVVEFSVPLYKPFSYTHRCCGCALVHKVTVQVVRGPIGLPWAHQRWEVDELETRKERVRKFGIDYMGRQNELMDSRW